MPLPPNIGAWRQSSGRSPDFLGHKDDVIDLIDSLGSVNVNRRTGDEPPTATQ